MRAQSVPDSLPAVEIRIRGYRSRRSLVTLPRALVVLALLGLGIWKLGPRLRGRKVSATAQAASGVASRGSAPTPATPLADAAPSAAPAAIAPGAPSAPARAAAPPPALAPPAPPVPAVDEVRTDIVALGPVIAQSTGDFDRLRADVTSALAGGAAGLTKLHDYPYKVQLLGAAVDHVPVRSLEARTFQTRYTRILYDASRQLADLLRIARKGAQAPEVVARKASFDKTSETLQGFGHDWTAFSKKYR